MYSIVECCSYSAVFQYTRYPEALCSLQNPRYSHQYICFPPMGVIGTWPELPERVLNIICISLNFLHTFAWNPPIGSTRGESSNKHQSWYHRKVISFWVARVKVCVMEYLPHRDNEGRGQWGLERANLCISGLGEMGDHTPKTYVTHTTIKNMMDKIMYERKKSESATLT